jgi:magnesium transporter
MIYYEASNEVLKKTEQRPEHGGICVCMPDELRRQEPQRFAPRTVDECEKSGPSKLEAYDGYDFIALNVIRDPEGFQMQKMGLYLTPATVYFVCAQPCQAVSKVIATFQETKTPKLSPVKVVYSFFNHLTAGDSEKLENLEDEISDIEEHILEGVEKDYILDIVRMRKRLMFYKKYYEQLLDVAESIEENVNGLLSSGALRSFRMFTARVERLNRNLTNLRDYITQVREAYQSQVDIGLNQIMKLFTVITAIFLPLTLLVGWYGMNFRYMPELQWRYGYFCVIVVSAAVVAFCIVYFKKKKML